MQHTEKILIICITPVVLFIVSIPFLGSYLDARRKERQEAAYAMFVQECKQRSGPVITTYNKPPSCLEK